MILRQFCMLSASPDFTNIDKWFFKDKSMLEWLHKYR